MRILITTFQGDIAGSTQSIFYLAKGLAEKGHTIYLGCREERWLYRLAQHTAIKVVPMRMKSKYSLASIREHQEVLKRYDIQLVNAQSSIDRYLPIFSKMWFGGNYKIVHTRRQRPASVGGFLQNYLYNKKTDRIVAVSKGVKKSLVQLGLDGNHISVIHNGLDVKKFDVISEQKQQLLREKYNIQLKDRVIGCISRFKDQIQIVQALHYVKTPCTLILIGVEKGQINTNTDFEVPHRVICTGIIKAEMAIQYYGLLELKILASSMEGLSQSLLEAMALGIPVIATNASGNPDLIEHKVNGLLFEDGDIQQLGGYIEQLLTDKSKRRQLAQQGQKTALENFSIQRTVDAYEKLYEELING